MKFYFTMFITQLLIIGMAINVRTDIPFWKQLVGYILIALIIPCAKFMENIHGVGSKQEKEIQINE